MISMMFEMIKAYFFLKLEKFLTSLASSQFALSTILTAWNTDDVYIQDAKTYVLAL